MLILCSCVKVDHTKGVIDCYSISVTEGGSNVFSGTYRESSVEVHEYKSEKGDSIYTNWKWNKNYYDGTPQSYPIRVYADRYTSEYTEYSYVGFVGWLSVEQCYYFDIDNNTIDAVTKYTEYRNSTNPSQDREADNKQAFRCAKKNYYLEESASFAYDLNRDPDTGWSYYYSLKEDIVEKGLEKHTYRKLGEDSIVEYRVKWF